MCIMWKSFFSVLTIGFHFHIAVCMVCNITGTISDWWCAKSQPGAQGIKSAINADSCFCAADKEMTQQEAFNYCSDIGGFLTDIQNEEENNLISMFLEALKTSPDMTQKFDDCGKKGVLYDGMCYVYHPILKMSWLQAEKYCQTKYKGNLPSIHNLATQQFLSTNLSSNCSGCSIFGFWVGGNDYGDPDKWIWSDGWAMDFPLQLTKYDKWAPQPEDPEHQQCMTIVKPDGGWGDWFCSFASPFPCVFPSAIYPAWISLQKSLSGGFHWNLGYNCPIFSSSYRELNATLLDKMGFVYMSDKTWSNVDPKYKTKMSICRLDRNICGRYSCTCKCLQCGRQPCSCECLQCTPTNNGTCYSLEYNFNCNN